MRIAYVAFIDAYHYDGVMNKISGQVSRWKLNGHEVRIFFICLHKNAKPAISNSVVVSVFSEKQVMISKHQTARINRMIASIKLRHQLKSYAPDIIYLRSSSQPFLNSALSKVPYVIEENSFDAGEMGRFSMRYLFKRIWSSSILNNANGLVCVTREIADSYEHIGKPTLVIGNGYDVQATSQLPAPNNQYPHLVFAGTPGQRWHGVDKIMWLARNIPEFTFHVVGPNANDIQEQVPDNIIIHGYVDQIKLVEIYGLCDIAIGTLALHRKQMNEASPLKVRDYLAHGLPVIIGYDDTDLPNDLPYILKLPNCESNVVDKIDTIRSFAYQMRGQRASREQIMSLIDYGAKETLRLKYMEGLLR